jgi:hypothetical protein
LCEGGKFYLAGVGVCKLAVKSENGVALFVVVLVQLGLVLKHTADPQRHKCIEIVDRVQMSAYNFFLDKFTVYFPLSLTPPAKCPATEEFFLLFFSFIVFQITAAVHRIPTLGRWDLCDT